MVRRQVVNQVRNKAIQASASNPVVPVIVIAVVITVVVIVAMAVIAVAVGVLLFAAAAAETTDCEQGRGAPSASVGAASAPVGAEGAYQLNDVQYGNVRGITAEVVRRRLPQHAAYLAVTTAGRESSLVVLGHGDAVGPDSRGLYQQRDPWGPLAVRMDVAGSTGLFLDRLVNVPGWQTGDVGAVIQAVQGSADSDGSSYKAWWATGKFYVDQVWEELAGATYVAAVPEPSTPAAAGGGPAVCGPNMAVAAGPVVVVGDSITVGSANELRAALPGRAVTIDAEVGRRPEQAVAVVERVRAQLAGGVLVVAACTNFDGDQAQFNGYIDQAMGLAGVGTPVVWVTCTEIGPPQAGANAAIRAAAGRFPSIKVAEWAGPSRTPGWLEADGIHPSAPGRQEFARIVAGAVPGPTVAGGYALPVDASWYARHSGWFTETHHDYPAADLPVPTGTPIYAAAAGTVLTAPVGGSCGDGVTIRSDDNVQWVYCHGQDGGKIVHPGDRVEAGQLIMHSGYTGHVEPPGPRGAHLHLQIGVNGRFVCPQPFLVGVATGRPVAPSALPDSGCTH